MQFELTAEQRMIADMVNEFAIAEGSSECIRRAMASDNGYLDETWQAMSRDLALPGLLIPEAAGGQELSLVEMALVFEQLGRQLLPSPLLSTSVLSAVALCGIGDVEHLGQIASGDKAPVEPGQSAVVLALPQPRYRYMRLGRPEHTPWAVRKLLPNPESLS